MGSPVTLTGFNKIDFGQILDAVMQQESLPLNAMQQKASDISSQITSFGTFLSKLGGLEGAADALDDTTVFGGRKVTITDDSIVSVSTGATTPVGTYDIIVNELARAQVTGSTSAHTDKDTTVVASGGTLTLGGINVNITGNVTLQGLSDAINATNDIPVTATIVSPSAGTYQLVLTGNKTGVVNAFAIGNGLTGGSGVTFGANAVNATDASVVVNGITVTSDSNTVTDAVAGATLTLYQKAPATTVTATVQQDLAGAKTKIEAFVKAYNDVREFISLEDSKARGGDPRSIAKDGTVRGMQNVLLEKLNTFYNVGGAFSYGAAVGIGFSSTGELEFDATLFDEAAKDDLADIQKLFVGSGGTDGLFTTLKATITEYTESGGIIDTTDDTLQSEVDSIETRMESLTERLVLRRATLQRQYIAYDQALSKLNGQQGFLSSLM